MNLLGYLTSNKVTVIESTSFECGEGDTISVRGYGRSKIFSFDGKSKKEKWKMVIGRQK